MLSYGFVVLKMGASAKDTKQAGGYFSKGKNTENPWL